MVKKQANNGEAREKKLKLMRDAAEVARSAPSDLEKGVIMLAFIESKYKLVPKKG